MMRHSFLLAASTLLLGVSITVVAGSIGWLGKPFPGFLVLENGVVASAGLSHWPATQGGRIYQHEISAVDGAPLADGASLRQAAERRTPGTELLYTFRRGDREFSRSVRTREFTGLDYTLLFGALGLNGLAFAGVALLTFYLRGGDRLGTGTFLNLYIAGIWALTAIDLYGPYHLFRLHALCETLLFAGTLHMALVFPHPSPIVARRPRLLWLPYLAAAPLVIANQLGLMHPPTYVFTHQLAVAAFGVSLVVLIASQVRWYLNPPDFRARQRVKSVALGAVAALSPGVIIALGDALTGGATPQNVIAFTAVFYPISIGYAVLRQDLLEVDLFVRRSVTYALLTAFATLSYVGLVQLLGLLAPMAHRSGSSVGFASSLLCVLLFLGLRDRVQNLINRLFFRTAYDFRRIVETTSARLASAADLDVIADELSRVVGENLHPSHLTLLVPDVSNEGYRLLRCRGEVKAEPDCIRELPRLRDTVGLSDMSDGGLCVPFRVDDRLGALLHLGRPLSGRLYGGDDRRLLQTLANQGAVAIENALALGRLRDLNRNLEATVEERTRELKQTQAQLVHREKMASLGQFVAGIAHELNNPINFIQGNLHCLAEYVDSLTRAVSNYETEVKEGDPELGSRFGSIREELELDFVLEDLKSAFDGCAEGIQRTTTLVGDLRTFSRLDQPERMQVNVHEAIESTLNVLRSKLTGIQVNRDFGELPLLECLAGQINQVFMNLIANAADATGTGGRIDIRTRVLDDEHVEIEVEDDGDGIEPAHLERIFDPFFTTKEVGKGTGLGLSISYGIVSRHGGTIAARVEPGGGTCFRVVLPVSGLPHSE